jgi:hypothetical protein
LRWLQDLIQTNIDGLCKARLKSSELFKKKKREHVQDKIRLNIKITIKNTFIADLHKAKINLRRVRNM